MAGPEPLKPLVGIVCCIKPFGIFGTPNHAVSDHYIRVVDLQVGGLPLLVPAMGEAGDAQSFVARIDGLMLTGSRSNVHPKYYDGPPHPADLPEDPARDGMTLPLIRAAIALGVPVLAICRGQQELNVALGGSLDQRIQDYPDRLDHSTPSDQLNGRVRTGKAHQVAIEHGGLLHGIVGRTDLAVNSLHNQAVCRLATALKVEATAPDGTIEGVSMPSARGFVLGVQWHPEYDYETDAASRAIFAAFGDACRTYAARRDVPMGVAAA
jgi:putative glutamine amidotransferase